MKKKNPTKRLIITGLILTLLPPTLGVKKAASVYFAAADRALLKHDYQTAADNYLKGMNYAYQKEKTTVWDDLGFVFLQSGQLDQAVEYLDAALEAYPDNYNLYFYRALAFLMTGDLQKADSDLSAVKENIYFNNQWMQPNEIPSSDREYYNRYGDKVKSADWEGLYAEKGILVRAVHNKQYLPRYTLFLDAFDERNEGVFHFVTGIVSWRLGEENRARSSLGKAAETGFDGAEINSFQTNPVGYELRRVLSLVSHRLRDNQNGLLFPEIQKFFEQLKGGEIEPALQRLEDALLIDEQSIDVNRNLALLIYELARRNVFPADQLKKAEAFAVRARWFNQFRNADDEERIECRTLLGNIYFHRSKYQQAAHEFTEILTIDPGNITSFYNLGSCFYHQSQFDLAEKTWKKGIELARPERPAEKAPEAGDMDISVKVRPVLYLIHNALGALCLDQDRIDEALSHLETATGLRPNEPLPHFHLAKANYQKNARDKALHHLQRYFYLGGAKNEEARALLAKLQK